MIIALLVSLACNGQGNIYRQLKGTIDSSWIKSIEELEKTKPSYFNNINSESVFISQLEISGYGVPFSWDSDFSILNFLMKKDSIVDIYEDGKADVVYLGTKLIWPNQKTVLLYIEDEIRNSVITDWYMIGNSECPAMQLFPNLNFEQWYRPPSPVRNTSKGIAIFPYPSDVTTIKEKEIKLKSKNGNSIRGNAYDLNNDQIPDVFIYQEPEFDENDAKQTSLFINLNGSWILKSNQLYETKCF